MNLQAVKQFFELFANKEAEAGSIKKRKGQQNFEKYNALIGELYALMDPALMLNSTLGYMTLTEHASLTKSKNQTFTPRHLFKISQYKHEKYGDLWVAFVGPLNSDNTFKTLEDVFFIRQEGASLKLVQTACYSDFSSDGEYYQWEYERDRKDLTFEALGNPVTIERYHEPEDYNEGLEHYQQDI